MVDLPSQPLGDIDPEFQVEEIDALAGEVMVSRASEKVLKAVHH